MSCKNFLAIFKSLLLTVIFRIVSPRLLSICTFKCLESNSGKESPKRASPESLGSSSLTWDLILSSS